MVIRIRKGLDLPITGVPQQSVESVKTPRRVAVIGSDYVGMKPTMEVKVGDVVKRGQLLFSDKKTEGVKYTAPAAGKVVEVNRAEKRKFQSVVIEAEGDAQEAFHGFPNSDLSTLSQEAVKNLLLDSGLWTAIRRRPYSRVAAPSESPSSIFVQAIDTQPLAPNPNVILAEAGTEIRAGLQVLRKLTTGKVYCCVAPGTKVPGADPQSNPLEGVQQVAFDGPHPAGLPGTHIHFLDPVSANKVVWYVNYQDVIAMGKLFLTGQLSCERVISLGGPQVTKPRLVRTILGASLSELTEGELAAGPNRVISGSVLGGRAGEGPEAYLGRYHSQVSVIAEGGEREFMGWQKPGFDKFSVKPIFASALADGLRFAFNSLTNGSPRALVPIGAYERVMPLDIEPTFLLRSLLTNDGEQAQLLGALELDEEDLALCTFVDPGKHEFGPVLRRMLTYIEREG
ncbi:MAG: Na(+)-translocating NADH-quinone reductase subunit A [Planctomycetaceae bacterium]|nr:Na(+)-translocating NADH-quinone reductase subunit A [Planctomycetaceae bacterium]